MKQGRRVANPAAKKLNGTYREDRHGTIVELASPPRNEPTMPGYLPPEAKAVWGEELRRVVACGATEADSSLFARYCAQEAAYRVAILAQDDVKIAALTELRRMAELLGIAGQRSRLARSAAVSPDKPASPFSVRPK